MWRLYCDDDGMRGRGVAMRTTLWRLEDSLAQHDLYVSPITYLDYQEAAPFDDERDALMHKRHGFAAEREVRLLRYDPAQYTALCLRENAAADLERHLFLDWSAYDASAMIVLSPYADVAYEHRAREALAAADPRLANRVVLSDLHERTHAPGF